VPDVWLDETAEGNVFAALRMREADLVKHLQGAEEGKADEAAKARDAAREAARQRLEEQMARRNEPPTPLPEFGSGEDWMLRQALNQLKGQPVVASKTAVERKAEAPATGN
jgi:carboxyl-terminal processing protease